MSALTTTQIIDLARAKLLESGTEILSSATLLIYANLTQGDLAKKVFTNAQIKTVTIPFVAGVGALPTDFGTMYGDAYYGTANYFPELSIEDFNKESLAQAVTIEGGTIKIYPNTTSIATFKYFPTLPALTLSPVVNPSVDAYFHELILYGILYRAHQDLQDEELSEYYKNLYKTELAEKIATQSNYEEGSQRSGQMFTDQNLLGGTSFF